MRSVKLENIRMGEVGTVFTSDNPRIFEVYQNVLYCAAQAYAESRDIPFHYRPKIAGEWLTDMEQDEFNELIQLMTETRIFGKNLNGPRANKENPLQESA